MKVFVVGGTGLLGSAAAAELIKRGHSVSSIALPPVPEGANIPEEMQLHFGSILELSDEELRAHLAGCDALIFAAGVDSRVEFPAPVYEAYTKYNIQPVQRILALAKDCGVKRAVVLGSYLAYFAKLWPEMNLADKHPYVRACLEQEQVALSFSDDQMAVMVLELPFVFGAQPGRKPKWVSFVKMLRGMRRVTLFPIGGTAMATVRQVSEAMAGAVERGRAGVCYPTGFFNMRWIDMLKTFNWYLGHRKRLIVALPGFVFKNYLKRQKRDLEARGIEPGIDPEHLTELMATYTFIDRKLIREDLGVTRDDIETAIGQSVKLSLKVIEENQELVEMRGE